MVPGVWPGTADPADRHAAQIHRVPVVQGQEGVRPLGLELAVLRGDAPLGQHLLAELDGAVPFKHFVVRRMHVHLVELCRAGCVIHMAVGDADVVRFVGQRFHVAFEIADAVTGVDEQRAPAAFDQILTDIAAVPDAGDDGRKLLACKFNHICSSRFNSFWVYYTIFG